MLALQVDLAIVHVSALPGQWWPIFGQKQGWVGEELRKKGCSRIILKVGIISPALQMKMVSSKVTSSLSRPSEATRSPTSRRLMSRCRNRNRNEKAKTDHLGDNGDGVSLEEVEGQ